jgi:AcrR family transcriptional regulator
LNIIGKQRAKREAAQEKICRAAIHCLARIGYGETSIQRVCEQAEVSKGALQHHFPTKQDLMTATADHLLSKATFAPLIGDSESTGTRNVRSEIAQIWEKFVNTDAYRALLEILIAIRTDCALQTRLSPHLIVWEKTRLQAAIKHYQAVSGSDEEVQILMTMTTSLMRGLIIQGQYSQDPAFSRKVVTYWLDIISERLLPR